LPAGDICGKSIIIEKSSLWARCLELVRWGMMGRTSALAVRNDRMCNKMCNKNWYFAAGVKKVLSRLLFFLYHITVVVPCGF